MQDSELIKKIEKIEELLAQLKLDLTERENPTNLERTDNQNKVSIGDWVEIKNPKKGQETEGKVVKKSSLTGYVTVEAKGSKKKIIRLSKNLKKVQGRR